MKNPLVSILICTYNASSTIEETILSCINQTYSNIEILIHDDQSKDNTLDIIKNIWNHKIIVITSWKKLWPYWGLNFLLNYAKGSYIAIQDHDDLWHPEKLTKQINFLKSKNWESYIGCGTKTLMRYESDQKWFEYFLWTESYYTIHPSLVFRNEWYRYSTKSIYMNDALFQKQTLCKWEKSIYNVDETLTFHRIKDGASNFSYKWFRYSWQTIRTVFSLHPLWYSICVIAWETMRQIIYPILWRIKKEWLIEIIERASFQLLGNKIWIYDNNKIKLLWFILKKQI